MKSVITLTALLLPANRLNSCKAEAVVWLLFGFIPTFFVGLLVGGLSAAAVFVKDKIKSRTANSTALKP